MTYEKTINNNIIAIKYEKYAKRNNNLISIKDIINIIGINIQI